MENHRTNQKLRFQFGKLLKTVMINLYLVEMNMIHLANVGLMLAHSLRRWSNIKPTLVQCVWETS